MDTTCDGHTFDVRSGPKCGFCSSTTQDMAVRVCSAGRAESTRLETHDKGQEGGEMMTHRARHHNTQRTVSLLA